MTKELEERLATLEKDLAEARRQATQTTTVTDNHAIDRRQKWVAKKIKLGAALSCIVILAIGAGVYGLNDQPASKSLLITRTALSQAEKTRAYPLYYPAQLPEDFQHNPTTVIIQDAFVSFSITSPAGSALTVTQQQRPPLMERVQLVGESSKNNLEPGRYVADLEGNYTGMILTNETLIMISGSEKAELQQLKQLLDSFEKV